MIQLHIRYYALLREQAGKSEESLSTEAITPAAVFAELSKRYPFTLSPTQLKVAINTQFRDWQTTLQNGDQLVFIPPVAGG